MDRALQEKRENHEQGLQARTSMPYGESSGLKASRPEPVCLMGNPQQFWVAEQNHGRELGWEMTLKIKEDLKEWQKAYTLFYRGE